MLKKSFFYITITFLGLSLFYTSHKSFAQAGNSPYSRFGLGEAADKGNIYNIGMGGLGIGAASQAYANVINPALLARNRFTCFDAGFWAEAKNLITEKELQATQSGNIGYLNFAFPITRKWTLGMGLNPYTIVNYTNKQEKLLAGTPSYITETYKGSGGINQAYVSSGFEVLKEFYLGLRVNYNFGVIKDQAQTFVDDGLSVYKVQLQERDNLGDFSFRFGAAYRYQVNKEHFLNIGATYDLAANISTNTFRAAQYLTPADAILYTDTLSNNSSRTNMPAKQGIGISFEKPFHYLIGFDFSTQDWAGATPNGVNTYKMSFGGEWTPNPNAIDNYFKRITWRTGVNYFQIPTIQNGITLDEKSVSIGFSAPVMRGLSSLNMAFVLGQRGTIEKGLIQENFFRINLGLTVNDQWFVRRKIN
jgi:hypothetical protein